MYSLTISFGPSAMVWAFLFKDKDKAREAFDTYVDSKVIGASDGAMIGSDDFGQAYAIPFNEIHGMCFEDLDQTEAARIQRSLAEERCKVKLMAAAKSDPVIGEAIRRSQGAPVLTPMGGFRQ